jgi:hypothetical protein
MKIKLKDDWELDCIVLKRNGEKVTFKYDSLEDKLIKIVEVKEEELKELFLNHSSNKPSILTKNKKPMSKDNHKLTIEQIKEIKQLAENKWTNKNIALRLGISPQLVNYWRVHTPRDINV